MERAFFVLKYSSQLNGFCIFVVGLYKVSTN